MRQKTITRLLQLSINKINRLDRELLLAHAQKKPREWVVAHPEYQLTASENRLFSRLLKKRSAGVPLAYLTGHKEFYGLDFVVHKHVLVPRPETETLVDLVVDDVKCQMSNVKDLLLIDVGTGSGCIPIAIAKTLKHTNTKTIKQIFAIDISNRALTVAKNNAKKHGVKIKFLPGNLLTPIIKHLKLKIKNLIITANLPYLTQKQYDSEPSIHLEPRLALVAEKKGLALYEELLKQLTQSHLPLATCHLFVEIDPSQSRAITKLIKKYFPEAEIEIKKDLSGLNRVVKVFLKHK